MDDACKKIKISKRDKDKIDLKKEDLEKLSHEELIEKVLQLKAHNIQLKNIIQKKEESNSPGNEKWEKKKKFDFEKIPKRHVLLKFYYLGWDYQGYVTQEDTNNTVEYFLFYALKKCCLIESRESSNYHRCGRTDKGVSAFSQVISIDLRSKVSKPSEENVDQELPYCSMLNRILPDNIRCYAWCHVGSSVSSRFDCSSRTYKYYFPQGNLNIKLMQEGARFLVGSHDFRNFCKMDVGNGVTEFQRDIKFIDIKPSSCVPKNDSGYQMFEFVIKGNGFLWHQIRCIMSVLFLIGEGKESPEVVKALLNIEENPSKPQYSLACHLPLNLYEVDYENIPTKWNIDDQELCKIIELLQSYWTRYSVKNTMIRDMIDNLISLASSSIDIEKQTEILMEGIKPKVYKPLLTRMKCESLENKIMHYVKKRKLKIMESAVEPLVKAPD